MSLNLDRSFSLDQKFALGPEVLFQRFEGKGLLVDLDGERVYQLNGTGARITEMIEGGERFGEILTGLESEYQASPEELARDVHTLLGELLEEKLIVIQASG